MALIGWVCFLFALGVYGRGVALVAEARRARHVNCWGRLGRLLSQVTEQFSTSHHNAQGPGQRNPPVPPRQTSSLFPPRARAEETWSLSLLLVRPTFVRKGGTRRSPAKGSHWNDLFGFEILHPMEIINATIKRRSCLGKREAAVQNNVLSSFVSHALSSRR